MKRKITMILAGALAAGAMVFGTAAPAMAAWYLSGFNSYSECGWSAYGKQLQGYIIVQGCTYRPYDGKWGYMYEIPRGHG